MESIKLVLKGFIIGIGKIIPGVSGAMFAMMFGVYEKAISIISDFRKLKGNVKFIFLLGISILIAILCGSSVIKTLLDNYYIQTMMFFVGMMSCGIKPLFSNIKGDKVDKKNIIFSLIVVALLIGMSIVDVEASTSSSNRVILAIVIMFICGFIDAVGTVIPGVCGTALLMLIGYYDKILTSLSNLLTLTDLENSLFNLIPFTLGLIVGIVCVSKLINYLFKNHRVTTYCSIIGFAISSTIILLIKAISVPFELNELFVAILLFIVGYIFVYILESKCKIKAK